MPTPPPSRPPFASQAARERFANYIVAGEELAIFAYDGDIAAILRDAENEWDHLYTAIWNRSNQGVDPRRAVATWLGWEPTDTDELYLERLGWFLATTLDFRQPFARAIGRHLFFLAGEETGPVMAPLRRRVLLGVRSVSHGKDSREAIEQALYRAIRAAHGETVCGRLAGWPSSQLALVARLEPDVATAVVGSRKRPWSSVRGLKKQVDQETGDGRDGATKS